MSDVSKHANIFVILGLKGLSIIAEAQFFSLYQGNYELDFILDIKSFSASFVRKDIENLLV